MKNEVAKKFFFDYFVSIFISFIRTQKHKKKTPSKNLESARKVRIKVTALSIASPSTILVTRELER